MSYLPNEYSSSDEQRLYWQERKEQWRIYLLNPNEVEGLVILTKERRR